MALSGRIQIAAVFDESPSVADLSSGLINKKLPALLQFLDGAGAGQANKIWGDSASQAQSTNNDLDLSGTLAGSFGTVVFTALKGLIVKAGAANPGDLIVGNAAANAFAGWFGAAAHTWAVAPGGILVAAEGSAAGRVVTAGTGDILRIASAATAGTYTYDVLLWGK